MIAQALVGINGVTLGQYGSIAVDAGRLDPEAPVPPTSTTTASAGCGRSSARRGAGSLGPVKWQFIGPVTLGAALTRAGLADDGRSPSPRGRCGPTSCRCRRGGRRAAGSPQIVSRRAVVRRADEPGFPIAPDPAIDLLSGAMASVAGVATVGVHCCADADVASLLAAGPDVLSIPLDRRLADVAGYLGRFLEAAAASPGASSPPTARFVTPRAALARARRPVGGSATGRRPALLRQRSLVTPQCGLGLHTPAVAERVVPGGPRDRPAGRRASRASVPTLA